MMFVKIKMTYPNFVIKPTFFECVSSLIVNKNNPHEQAGEFITLCKYAIIKQK